MAIESIQSINNILDQMSAVTNAGKANGTGFANVFEDAMANAVDAEQEDYEGSVALLSGEINDLHSVTLEVQQAELTLRLAVEMRNKLLEAYNELMRMSV